MTINDLRKYLSQKIEDKIGPKLPNLIQNELKTLQTKGIVSLVNGKLTIVSSGSERTTVPKRVQTSRKKKMKQKTFSSNSQAGAIKEAN